MRFIYAVMNNYATSNGSGANVLNYPEHEDDKKGSFKHFTEYNGVCKKNLTKVKQKLETEMKHFSQKSLQFKDGLHLDSFLPDYDIKVLLENHIGCPS